MDWTSIVVAVIAAIGSFVGVYLSNRKSSALWQYRLEQLEHKVDLHNNVIERTYKLEESHAILDERIRMANHRIDDLEKERNRDG